MDGQVEGMGSEKSALHIISLRGVVDQCPFLFGCVWVAVRSLSKFQRRTFFTAHCHLVSVSPLYFVMNH